MNLIFNKEKTITKLKSGWVSDITMPELEFLDEEMFKHEFITEAFNIKGLAILKGTCNRPIKVNKKIKISENSFTVEKGTTDGNDLNIPWKSIINCEKEEKNLVLNLIDGYSIKFTLFSSLKREQNFIVDFINSHACGITK